MLIFPENTVLGRLEIIQVFEFYDFPRLFLCANLVGSQFLALSTFDDHEKFEWLYLPISKDRFASLVSQKVSLRDCFLNPEDGYLFKVVTMILSEPVLEHVFSDQIQDDDLPLSGVFLSNHEGFNLGLGEVNANKAALGSMRETINIRFSPNDTKLPELDIKELGGVLTSFQELTHALGQYCKEEPTLKGAIRADIVEATRFRATQIFEGSFGIQFKSKSYNDLFGASLATDVLKELIGLLESRDDEDNISNKLHILEGRVASKYRVFLKCVSQLRSPLNVHWGSPVEGRGSEVFLSKREISDAYKLVSKIETDISESVEFRAELLGLDVTTKKYRVRHLDENQDYVGKISDEATDSVTHSEINGHYIVVLKKVIETNSSSGAEHVKWLLTGLKTDN